MNFRYLLCICAMLIHGGISYSQNSLVTNLDIIDRLIDESFEQLANRLVLSGKENIFSADTYYADDAGRYFSDRFRNRFSDYKIVYNEGSDSSLYSIKLGKPEISVKYTKISADKVLGNKKVSRIVRFACDIRFVNKKDTSLSFSSRFTKDFRDSFALDKAGMIEDMRFSFTYAEIPDEDTTDRILFPAVLITASALAIILFFIIRSK